MWGTSVSTQELGKIEKFLCPTACACIRIKTVIVSTTEVAFFFKQNDNL